MLYSKCIIYVLKLHEIEENKMKKVKEEITKTLKDLFSSKETEIPEGTIKEHSNRVIKLTAEKESLLVKLENVEKDLERAEQDLCILMKVRDKKTKKAIRRLQKQVETQVNLEMLELGNLDALKVKVEI